MALRATKGMISFEALPIANAKMDKMISNINKQKLFSLFILICFCLISGLASLHLGQDINWDLRNYHFYNAYAFLTNRLIYDIAPAQVQTYNNPILDIPFYFIILAKSHRILYGFLIGAFHGINIWLVYMIAFLILTGINERKRHLLSIVAAITGYCGAASISEIGTTFQDNILSLFVLGGLILIILIYRNKFLFKDSLKLLCIAGFLVGFGTGLKLTGIIYFLAFLFTLLLVAPSGGGRIKNAFIFWISGSIGIIISAGYQMFKLWEAFGNPLFPFYNAIFRSPYYTFNNTLDRRFLPHDIYQAMFYPFYFVRDQHLVSELIFRDYRLSICYALFMACILIAIYKRINKKSDNIHLRHFAGLKSSNDMKIVHFFIIVFFVLSYICWEYEFSIYRYILSLELLSPVFIAIMLKYLFVSEKSYIRSVIVVFMAIIMTTMPMDWGRRPWSQNYFDVKIPAIKDLSHFTVIYVGGDAFSYIIPFFPKETRFIGVENNLIKISSNTLMQEQIKKIISKNDKLLLIYNQSEKINYDNVLAFYGLEIKAPKKIAIMNMMKIHTNIGDNLLLVPLKRKTNITQNRAFAASHQEKR